MTSIQENQTSRDSFRNMEEPSGFVIDETTGEVKRDDSVLSWSNGARQCTILPNAPATSYIIYIEGVARTISASKNVIITDTEGLWFFYFDNTLTLQATQTFDINFVYSQGYIAVGYWDAVNKRMLFDNVFDERHGCKMDGHTHAWLHQQMGTRYQSGLALTNFSVDGSGDLDIHAQFGSDLGIIYDEDLKFSLAAIASTVGLPILYHEATGIWRQTTNAGFSVLTTGTGRLAYNPSGSGLLEVGNNDYVNCHVFATSGIDVDGILAAIVGQQDYGNLNQAREGASNEINALILAGLPVQEFKFIGTVIFQTNTGYANAVKGRVRSTDLGDDYVDFRRSNLTAAGSTGAIHNSFADDDHLQYLNLNGRSPDQDIPDGTTATTQSPSDNSTKIATTAYADNAVVGGVDEANVYYVRSNGSDSNTGLNLQGAFLTIQKGIDTADLQTPALDDEYTIRILEGGTFDSFDLTGKPYINISGDGALLKSTGSPFILGGDFNKVFVNGLYSTVAVSSLLNVVGSGEECYLRTHAVGGAALIGVLLFSNARFFADIGSMIFIGNTAIQLNSGAGGTFYSHSIEGDIVIGANAFLNLIVHNLTSDINISSGANVYITVNGIYRGDITTASGATLKMNVAVRQTPYTDSIDAASTVDISYMGGVREDNIYYVRSNGDDTKNNGFSIDRGFLTIQKGIDEAFAQSPTSSSQYVVRIEDGGSFAGFTLASKPYISVNGSASQFQTSGSIGIGDDNSILFDKAGYVSSGGVLFSKSGAGTAYLKGNEIFGSTTTLAIEITLGILHATVDNINILVASEAIHTRNGTALFSESKNINGKIILDSTSTASVLTYNQTGDIDVKANSTLYIVINGLFTGDIIAAAGATIKMEVGSRAGGFADSIDSAATVDIHYMGKDNELQRNLLVGGDYRINPRQENPIGILAVAQSDDEYIADNTIILSDGFQIVAINSPVSPDRNLSLTIATANKQFGILLPIENSDAEEVIGGTASMSLRAGWTAVGTRNLRAGLISWSGTADSITSDPVSSWGATPTLIANWTYENTPSDLTFSGVGTFSTFKIEDISVDTASTTNVAIFVWVSDTTTVAGETLEFSNVRCTKGDVVGEFAPRPYAEEVALCQRYYSKSYDMGTAPRTVTYIGCQTADKGAVATTGFAGMNIRYPQPMLKTPTVTPYPTTTPSSGTITLHTGATSASSSDYVSDTGAVIKRNSTVSGTYQAFFHWVADGRL